MFPSTTIYLRIGLKKVIVYFPIFCGISKINVDMFLLTGLQKVVSQSLYSQVIFWKLHNQPVDNRKHSHHKNIYFCVLRNAHYTLTENNFYCFFISKICNYKLKVEWVSLAYSVITIDVIKQNAIGEITILRSFLKRFSRYKN